MKIVSLEEMTMKGLWPRSLLEAIKEMEPEGTIVFY